MPQAACSSRGYRSARLVHGHLIGRFVDENLGPPNLQLPPVLQNGMRRLEFGIQSEESTGRLFGQHR